MPISVDLEENPFLKGIVEHVRMECTIENIMMVLHARFDRVPITLSERLRSLSQVELDRILVQGATALTLDQAIRIPLTSLREEVAEGPSCGSSR